MLKQLNVGFHIANFIFLFSRFIFGIIYYLKPSPKYFQYCFKYDIYKT